MNIFGAISDPHNIPNGATINVNVSFRGISTVDGTKVRVKFSIHPFPDLNFEGNKSVIEDYIFDRAVHIFTKTIRIVNSSKQNSPIWLDGEIRLVAITDSDSEKPTDETTLQYK